MRRDFLRAARLAVALAVACAGLDSIGAGAQAPVEERRIVVVRVVADTGAVLAENPAALALQPGQAYDAEAVRESLRQLYRTGRYAEVRAEAAAVAGGVRVDFVVQRNFYVNLVRIAGLAEPPSEGTALAALRLALGEPFRESELEEALERLRELLREEGFYQARVEHELAPNEATRQMNITVRVTPGPRARIGAVELHNRTEFPSERLLARSKLRAGNALTSARLERAAERLRKFLVGKGHLAARVGVRRGEYDAKAGTLPLALEVTAAPKVRVEVAGMKIRDADLRKLLPIYEEGAVDEDLLQEGRRNLRDYLERQGYFDSQVRFDVAQNSDDGQQVIRYAVERGPRRRLVAIAFDGNHYFSDELLRDRLRVQTGEFLSPGRFSRRLADADADAIRLLYVANGFREVDVSTELVEKYRGKEDDLFLRFHIREGEQTRIAALDLEGNRALAKETLLGVLGSTPGQPYSEFNVVSDRDNVLAVYYNEGFPEARFEWLVTPAAEPNRIRLLYRIFEGRQTRVAQVLLDGYETTRRGVIAREVQVQPGRPLREGEVVETQRRLYNLGIFNRVQIAPQNPAGTDTEKAVVVLVEEAKRTTLAYGFGFEVQRLGSGGDPVSGQVRASPRGLLEVTRANFAGRAHTLAFKARASTLQGRALLSYTAPNFLARPSLSLLFTGLADRTRDVRTFTSTRYEGAAQLEQRLSPLTTLLYRYSFRRVLVDPGSLRVSDVPLFSQPTKISALGFTWVRDRRDNPADASRGHFFNGDISIAGKRLGSSATFVRLFFQNSTFHPFGRHLVFARSARFGTQEPFGDTTAEQIPLPERFFAGGGTTLRGFGLNQAGPRDQVTGFPLGGGALLVFNHELRFPMRLPKLGNRLGGAVFYDAGNVFSSVRKITLRGSPSADARSTGELNYFSHTIGFGFRYATPIGPVRVDLGYQLNPARFEFCETSTVTAPGRCPDGQGLRTARLPRFQFFFNIGSIF